MAKGRKLYCFWRELVPVFDCAGEECVVSLVRNVDQYIGPICLNTMFTSFSLNVHFFQLINSFYPFKVQDMLRLFLCINKFI